MEKRCFLCKKQTGKNGSFCESCFRKMQTLDAKDLSLLLESANCIRALEKEEKRRKKRLQIGKILAVGTGLLAFLFSVLLPFLALPLREAYLRGLWLDAFLAFYGLGLLLLFTISLLLMEKRSYRLTVFALLVLGLLLYGNGLSKMPSRIGEIPIKTAEDFFRIEDFEGGHFVLQNDLDLADTAYAGKGIRIAGRFSGQGYTIRCTAKDTVLAKALFLKNTGLIEEVYLQDCRFSAEAAAALCFENRGKIRDCFISDTVFVEGKRAASLVFKDRGELENCLSLAGVLASEELGGLVHTARGYIAECDFQGKLSALGEEKVKMGGIACILKSGARLENISFTGSMDAGQAEVSAGVFAAESKQTLFGKKIRLNSCLSRPGERQGSFTHYSVFVADISGRIQTENVYYPDSESSGRGRKGLSKAEFTSQYSFDGFDFSFLWVMKDGCPRLVNSQRMLEKTK